MTSPEKDPTARRRQDREAQRDRDAETWRLQRAGWSVRAIARELAMPASSVQRCLQRAQKREQLTDALASGEPGNVLAVVVDGELTCEDVRTSADVERLGGLERYRLQFMDSELGRAERATVTAEREAERQRFAAEHADEIARDGFARAWDAEHQTRVSDGHSSREGADAALSDDSGVDAADDW